MFFGIIYNSLKDKKKKTLLIRISHSTGTRNCMTSAHHHLISQSILRNSTHLYQHFLRLSGLFVLEGSFTGILQVCIYLLRLLKQHMNVQKDLILLPCDRIKEATTPKKLTALSMMGSTWLLSTINQPNCALSVNTVEHIVLCEMYRCLQVCIYCQDSLW